MERHGQSNGAPPVTVEVLNGDEGPEEEEPNRCWPFLPPLDQFNLMDSDIDLSLIEQVLEDSKYALSLFVSLSLCLSVCLCLCLCLCLSLSLSLSISHYGWSHLC